jgi:H2-forming N5,N10-methylenetetrahydromethanopterin dehydrogenase-like enzyme
MASKSSGKRSSQSSSRSGGSGRSRGNDFPLDNNTYNVITVIHEKSKGLEAFDEYLQDADEELRELLQEIREQDTRAIEQLQEHLRRLVGGEGAESEDEEAA